MRKMTFAGAIEDALGYAMSRDERIMIMGEDVQMIRLNLFARFGKERILSTPISESAFLGAAVGAAMGGLRPVVEIMIVDFIGVAMDAVLNHAAKTEFFSGGNWNVPLVIRAACGGGYGDGGQHEQSLWGWFAHIPGLKVVVPSTPADAGGLLLAALDDNGPVIYLEHKLLADYWLDYLGAGGRKTVTYNIPAEGARGPVPDNWESVPLGQAAIRREGTDITICSIGVSVHRAVAAASELTQENISAEVIDLRTVAPIDITTIMQSVCKTNHLIVVDEDYREFGLSGEIAAQLLENGIKFKYGRVCTEQTIPYSRHEEDAVLPGKERIISVSKKLLE